MKVELKPSKKVAPNWLPYFIAFVYVVGVVFIVITLIKMQPYYLAVTAFIGVVCFIISKCFSWYKSAELRTSNEFVTYEVENIIGFLGRNKTKYIIKNISSYEESPSVLKIVGDIEVFEPMSKGRTIKEIEIDDYTPESLKLIKDYFKIA